MASWQQGLHAVSVPENIKQSVRAKLSHMEKKDIDAKVDAVEMFAIWATYGDIVVFDGSALHGVSNDVNPTSTPQLVLAVNIGVGNGLKI